MLGSKTMTFGPKAAGPVGGGAAAEVWIPTAKSASATVTAANPRSGDMTYPLLRVVVRRAAGAQHRLAHLGHRILRCRLDPVMREDSEHRRIEDGVPRCTICHGRRPT